MAGWSRVFVGFVAGVVVSAVILVAAGVGDDGEDGPGGMRVTEEGLVFEPAANVGPGAFTPPVDTADDRVCDKERLVRELQARPDALREWARVLGVSEADVPAYVDSLQPIVLTTDTPVTNHGLRNGQAYARQSLLQKGTAVLGDVSFPGLTTPLTPLPTTTTPATTTTTGATTTTTLPDATTTTTAPGAPTPVTRCKCGNPLLPPYKGAMGVETTTTSSTSATTTTIRSGGTTTTVRGTAATTSSTTTTTVVDRRTTTTTTSPKPTTTQSVPA